MHPVAVVFEFVQPLRPVRRLIDQFGDCGLIQPGSAAASSRCLPASDRTIND
jgi:hypothetical protein